MGKRAAGGRTADRNDQAAATVTPSSREMDVCLRFGLTAEPAAGEGDWPPDVALRAGQIVLVTGPSGSGKTTRLRALAALHDDAVWIEQTLFPSDVSVVDAVAPGQPLDAALGLLTACGLGEARLWLRRFAVLSEGEQFRARLARALSLQAGKRTLLLCDEFCNGLHRRLARAVAYNLRKLVTRARLCLVLATCHEDLCAELRPDVVVRLDSQQQAHVERPTYRSNRAASLRRLRVEQGCQQDYTVLAEGHYRQREQLGFVDRVFVARDGAGGEPLAVVVYAHAPLELALRNRATDGRFVRNAKRLNREVRIIRRLIVHPDVRGCGVGHWLVRKTLPMIGTAYVECLAAMGLVNPVFERAGMQRVGVCEPPEELARHVATLRGLGIDPLDASFTAAVSRRPRVRRIVALAVANWYRATTGGGEKRVLRQSPVQLAATFRQMIGSQPVYYLWSRDGVFGSGVRGAA